jgi:glycosyltransferase involved in cell wall biosynthesis
MNDSLLKEPKVSVVIPVFNCANFIGDAVESVLCQTLKPIEIIVVNDGSTDNTNDILKKYSGKIICIQQENRGPASARNNGIRNAKGEFIAFLDSDDIWVPNKLERQMEVFLRNPDLAMVYSRCVDFDSEDGTSLANSPTSVYSGEIFEKLLTESFIPLPSVVVRSWILTAVGMFDESLITAEDNNLYLKIAKTWHIFGLDEVLVRRRRHAGNLSFRADVPIGTLKNLDRIVALYPETAPEKWPPMKRAYLLRGRGMMSDLFVAAEYSACQKIAARIHHLHPFDLTAMRYYFLTLFPARLLNYVRRFKHHLNVKVINRQ